MRSDVAPPKPVIPATCATHIVQDGISSTVIVLMPILAQVFGFSYAQVGFLKGVKSIAQAVFEISSGWITERMGEGRLMAFGLGVSGLGYLLMSVAPSAVGVALCLMILGVGTALHHAPCSALIANSFAAGARSGPLGIYNASGDVGKLAFTGSFSLAVGLGLGWQEVSLIYGVLGILTGVGVAYVLQTRPPVSKAVSAPVSGPPSEQVTKAAADTQSAPQGWGILDWRSFGALLAVSGIDTLVQSCVMVFVAFVMLAKGLALPFAVASTVLLLAGGTFGKAGCGYLSQRMGLRRAFTLIQIIAAVGLVVVVIAPPWVAVGLLLPLGAVVQGTSSITYGFAADLMDPRRMARGYALLYSAGTFASAVGPLAIGVFADRYGIHNAMFVIAAISVCAIPPIYLVQKPADVSA